MPLLRYLLGRPLSYHHVMHNYSALLLKARLFLEGSCRVVIVDLPWQLPPASS